MPKTDYPDSFYRGLSSKDFVKDNVVQPAAFQFKESENNSATKEASINWNDDGNALKLLLTQKKADGTIQFKGGATELYLNEIKMALKIFFSQNKLFYERKPIEKNDEQEENPYHGNLLVKSDLTNQERLMITGTLASLGSNKFIPQESDK